jgi:hypothetical protein
MRAARVAAANRDFVRFRDGLSNDGTENARENDLNRARGGKRGNDLKADGILREASVEEATTRPTWAGETPARNLGAEARSSSAVAVDRPDANETTNEKTNEREEDGAFAAWMEGKGARRGHTRTPSAYREGYDAANEKFGLRLNHGVARLCGNLEGDAVLPDHGLSNGGLSGGSMAAMRSAIASASRASAERRETARRHLGSRAGILS